VFQHALLGKHVGFAVDLVDKKIDLNRPIVDYSPPHATTSSFGYVVAHQWMGLAFLMIDAGIQITSAVRDALMNAKFQLVLTLLSKTDATKIQSTDSTRGYNLLHVLGAYDPGHNSSARTAFDGQWALKIATVLSKYELPVSAKADAKTEWSREPLHLAAANGHTNYSRFLLSKGAGLQSKDLLKKTPLYYAVEK
jgi:hypothetical protein